MQLPVVFAKYEVDQRGKSAIPNVNVATKKVLIFFLKRGSLDDFPEASAFISIFLYKMVALSVA